MKTVTGPTYDKIGNSSHNLLEVVAFVLLLIQQSKYCMTSTLTSVDLSKHLSNKLH